MTLSDFFKENPRVALGFSGGVDSSYLLYAAKKCGAQVGAYFIKTVFQPEFEFRDALRLAKDIGVDVRVVEADILSDEDVANNPNDRCYHCKTRLFTTLKNKAEEDGFTVLIDGTNASDDSGDRPGMKALSELKVLSPLRDCGLTKARIRELSREAGLFTWDKPAYACLATRVPSGRKITAELLKKVENVEDMLFSMGFTDFRVRVLEDAARLQINKAQINMFMEKREEIVSGVGEYFDKILLDIKELR